MIAYNEPAVRAGFPVPVGSSAIGLPKRSNMNKTSKMQWMLAAAVSVTLATGAMAQFRVGTDGRALDASNRIGSNGYNSGYGGQANVSQGNYLQNNLITGNITGGKQFRGSVPYQSPDSFRGNTAGGLSDRFIRSSSAAPYGGVPQNNAQAVQSFYGVSNAAPPPPGYVQQGGTAGAFVPAKPMSRAAGDLRLGQIQDAPTNSMLPQPGQFLMPGPVDPNTSASTVITGSPLYGVRQWNTANLNDQQFLNSNMSMSSGTNLGSKLDPVTLQRMRSELIDPVQPNNQLDQNDLNKPQAPLGGASGSQNLSGSALTPMESPKNQPLGGASILQSNDPQSNSALSGSLQTGATASARQRPGANPIAQSTQYAELQKRMNQYRIIQENTDANANATDARPKKTEPAKKPTGIAGATGGGQSTLSGAGTMGTGMNAVVPGNGGLQTRLPSPPAPPSGATPPPTVAPAGNVPNGKPAPVQVKSLADGVKAAGLASLMKDAEEQMRAGKFSSALDKYDDADQVAPGDPFVMLGKANALLGQSYYARAERALRDAFMKDQNLLLGQYDLRSFLSADRLQFLVTELKGLADAEQKEPRHAFLLAYIAYNSGFEAQASAYLALAEQRSGGNDPLYPLIRKYWSLPTQTEAPVPLNK